MPSFASDQEQSILGLGSKSQKTKQKNKPWRDPTKQSMCCEGSIILRGLFKRPRHPTALEMKTWEITTMIFDKGESRFLNAGTNSIPGKEGKKPREIRGKICNALFKPKQTHPDRLALRFWKLGMEGMAEATSHRFKDSLRVGEAMEALEL